MKVRVAVTRQQRKRLARIENWDFSQVIKLALREGIPAQDINDLLEQYKRYMALVVLFPKRVQPISEEVDRFYHCHLLCTENYSAFCEQVFGVFGHHIPALDEAEKNKLRASYEQTRQSLNKVFGELSNRFWAPDRMICFCRVDTTIEALR